MLSLKVCGTDGVTYADMATMRARGGNIRPDYMGRCMDDDTPMQGCEMVREAKRCPNMTDCTRMTRPSDGCCPICGESASSLS